MLGMVVMPPLLPGRALDLAKNNNNKSSNNNNNNKNTLGMVVLPPLKPGRTLDLAKNNNNNNNGMIIVPPRDRSQSSVSRMRRQSRGALI